MRCAPVGVARGDPRRWLALLLVAGMLGACSAGGGEASGPTRAPGGPVDLTIYGAASLKGVLEAATTAYAATSPGSTLTLSTDSSATLATQIEQGAPADVFLSADSANPQRLVDAGLADGLAVPFAGNALAIIVPIGDPAGIATPSGLATPGVQVIAAGDDVPITRYAGALVDNLAAQPGYPADFAAAYAANVVSKEDNVKAVVAKIELGEGDAAIVYVTDAAASDAVATIAVPAAVNVSTSYAGIVVRASAHPVEARAFLDWLAGPAGQAVLDGFGFLPAP